MRVAHLGPFRTYAVGSAVMATAMAAVTRDDPEAQAHVSFLRPGGPAVRHPSDVVERQAAALYVIGAIELEDALTLQMWAQLTAVAARHEEQGAFAARERRQAGNVQRDPADGASLIFEGRRLRASLESFLDGEGGARDDQLVSELVPLIPSSNVGHRGHDHAFRAACALFNRYRRLASKWLLAGCQQPGGRHKCEPQRGEPVFDCVHQDTLRSAAGRSGGLRYVMQEEKERGALLVRALWPGEQGRDQVPILDVHRR